MMNGLQSLPPWRRYFGNPDGALLGAMNSVYPAGKVVALFLVTWLADRFGRKFTIVIGVVACIAFALMQGFAQNFSTFIAARAILGFFTSFLAQPSPILVAELAYPTHRGKITALYNTSFVGAEVEMKMASQTNGNSTWAASLQPGWHTASVATSQSGPGEFHPSCKEPYPSANCSAYTGSLNHRDGS
jgi:sugar phosphate permease